LGSTVTLQQTSGKPRQFLESSTNGTTHHLAVRPRLALRTSTVGWGGFSVRAIQ